jgi:hypothetical protein
MPTDRANDPDWSLVTKRVALWAAIQLPRRLWRGSKDGHTPGAEEVQDLVQDAVVCALERRNEWTTKDGPDAQLLVKIMKGRVTHRIAHLSALAENRNVHLETIVDKNPDSRDLSTEANLTSSYGLSPGSLLAEERRHFVDELKTRAYRSLESDSKGQEVFAHMADGVTEPRIIAQETGMTTREVDNIKKRISRTFGSEFHDPQKSSPWSRGRKPDGR